MSDEVDPNGPTRRGYLTGVATLLTGGGIATAGCSSDGQSSDNREPTSVTDHEDELDGSTLEPTEGQEATETPSVTSTTPLNGRIYNGISDLNWFSYAVSPENYEGIVDFEGADKLLTSYPIEERRDTNGQPVSFPEEWGLNGKMPFWQRDKLNNQTIVVDEKEGSSKQKFEDIFDGEIESSDIEEPQHWTYGKTKLNEVGIAGAMTNVGEKPIWILNVNQERPAVEDYELALDKKVRTVDPSLDLIPYQSTHEEIWNQAYKAKDKAVEELDQPPASGGILIGDEEHLVGENPDYMIYVRMNEPKKSEGSAVYTVTPEGEYKNGSA